MKRISVLSIAIVGAMALLSAIGFASATTTTITTGSLSDSNSLVWTISSNGIDGVLVPGERQSTTTYSDNTQAYGGTSYYTRSLEFDTKNKYQGQYNVESTKMFTFDGTGQGGMSGIASADEQVGIDTMGMPVRTADITPDPFAAAESEFIPAFHNTVNAGSSFDLAQGTVLTRAQARTVTPSAGVPVALNYGISVHGLGSNPAIGSAGAFMDGHLEQGRGNSTAKSSDLAFSQQTSVQGLIYRFDKTVTYESGINR